MSSDPTVSTTNPEGDSFVIPYMIPVFVCIALLALSGNLLVILLFVRNREWLKKAHSNLILMLAITDISTAICILCVPGFIHESDVYPVPKNEFLRELYCRVVWSQYIVFSLGVTSVYLCLSLAIERWLAIKKPFFYKQHLNSRRGICLLVVLPWIAGFTFESSSIVKTTGLVLPDGTTSCRWDPDTSEWATRVTIAVVPFCGMILLPGMLVILAYVHILLKLKEIRNPHSEDRNERLGLKRVTLMAGLASVTLLTCWLPDQIHFMLLQMGYLDIYSTPHYWLIALALSSSCWNTIIYCFSNPLYREGFKSELSRFLCLCKLVRRNRITTVCERQANEIPLEAAREEPQVEHEKTQKSESTAF